MSQHTLALAIVSRLVLSCGQRSRIPSQIRPCSRLREDLGMDSLDLVRLQVGIEDEFGTRLDPLTLDVEAIFDTVDSLATYIDDTFLRLDK